ncbi:MAG TPA: hypothetical protein VLS96_12465 [Nodosilinea sp.]|nr:hypothetical protein [Nodosilinea sp.]
MSDGHSETTLERRVALPEPDVSNITVLTESLPNEPVLPWHHFDSPWLERDGDGETADAAADPDPEPEPDQQLTLELEVLIDPVDHQAGEPDDHPSASAA